MVKACSAALCAISLVACSAMRSEYQQPKLDIPQGWSRALLRGADTDLQKQSGDSASLARPEQWWTLFQDPQLNSLIDRILTSNSDLEKATLVLRKALLEAGISENNKVPRLGFAQNSSREYELESNSSGSSYGAGLSLSYELDLWNRVDALADASELAARASYEDRESLAQDLVVTAATLYWKLGYLNQKITLVSGNLRDSERIAALTRLRYDNGANTQLDVAESSQAVLNQQLQLSQLQQELAETRNAISILLNKPLQETGVAIDRLPDHPIPDIAAGLPADLLLRRPDIRASLYNLQSALAVKDAVVASYLPTITLTGAVNTSSSSLVELLKNPVAKLGSGMVLPFLEWHQMQLNKDIAEVDYQTAVVDYRDTIYRAFEEVDNLLTAKKHYEYQGNVYKEQHSNAREIERIYESKYTHGESDMIEWFNAIESRRNIESSLLENKYNQLVIQARLYQSLGGGDIVNEFPRLAAD